MRRKPVGEHTENLVVDRERELRLDKLARSETLDTRLGELFEQHRPQLRRLCLDILGDPELADEVVQETMVRAWDKLDEFDGRVRFRYWVYGIARNLCRNAKRKQADLLTEDGVVELGSVASDAMARLRAEERARILREASAAVLEPLEQEAVHLRYVEGMRQGQITELLGLDGSGGRALLQRCRRKLRRELMRRLELMGHGVSLLEESVHYAPGADAP